MEPDPNRRLADQGPVYAETDLSAFPVECYATWSNLIFPILIGYWLWRLHGHYAHHRMLTIALPILAVGWIGGTIYHATRSHVVWLVMDWLPIAILVLIAAGWLWRRIFL